MPEGMPEGILGEGVPEEVPEGFTGNRSKGKCSGAMGYCFG